MKWLFSVIAALAAFSVQGQTYPAKPVKLIVWRADPPGPDDLCRRSRPENERGFANTERVFV